MALGGLKDESDLKRWLERHEKDAPGQGAELRTLRGTVDTSGSGSIVAGSGFTVARNGAGDVTITFSTPFSSPPSCPASSDWYATQTAAATASTARFVAYNFVAGVPTPADGIIHFIAVGPG